MDQLPSCTVDKMTAQGRPLTESHPARLSTHTRQTIICNRGKWKLWLRLTSVCVCSSGDAKDIQSGGVVSARSLSLSYTLMYTHTHTVSQARAYTPSLSLSLSAFLRLSLLAAPADRLPPCCSQSPPFSQHKRSGYKKLPGTPLPPSLPPCLPASLHASLPARSSLSPLFIRGMTVSLNTHC